MLISIHIVFLFSFTFSCFSFLFCAFLPGYSQKLTAKLPEEKKFVFCVVFMSIREGWHGATITQNKLLQPTPELKNFRPLLQLQHVLLAATKLSSKIRYVRTNLCLYMLENDLYLFLLRRGSWILMLILYMYVDFLVKWEKFCSYILFDKSQFLAQILYTNVLTYSVS